MSDIFVKTYQAPAFNINEALRYAGVKSDSYDMISLMNDCMKETEGIFNYMVCYGVFPKKNINSIDLNKNLQGCSKIIIFGATVGIKIDSLIRKYSRILPSKALVLQAIGAERIESLCDLFCDDISQELNVKLKPRFSPGYGDFNIESQIEIFKILDCAKRIGLTLNDSMLMSPTKSVTAIVGIKDEL